MALVSCPECGRKVSELAIACPNCGHPNQTPAPTEIPASTETPVSNEAPVPKSKSTAVVLALFLGIFGAHKFYMGSSKLGILYLVFSWTTIPFFLGLIDALILVSKDPSFFAGSVGVSREPAVAAFDEYGWRSSSSGFVPSSEEKQGRKIIGLAVVAVLGVFLVYEFWQSSSDGTSTPSTSSVNNSSPSNAAADQACSAMKSADMAVATLGKKVTNGNAAPRDAGSVKSALKRVNAAYPKLDGAFYSYLVGQGNAMDLLIRGVESGDFYSAGIAVQSYLNGDKYSTYCR